MPRSRRQIAVHLLRQVLQERCHQRYQRSLATLSAKHHKTQGKLTSCWAQSCLTHTKMGNIWESFKHHPKGNSATHPGDGKKKHPTALIPVMFKLEIEGLPSCCNVRLAQIVPQCMCFVRGGPKICGPCWAPFQTTTKEVPSKQTPLRPYCPFGSSLIFLGGGALVQDLEPPFRDQ